MPLQEMAVFLFRAFLRESTLVWTYRLTRYISLLFWSSSSAASFLVLPVHSTPLSRRQLLPLVSRMPHRQLSTVSGAERCYQKRGILCFQPNRVDLQYSTSMFLISSHHSLTFQPRSGFSIRY